MMFLGLQRSSYLSWLPLLVGCLLSILLLELVRTRLVIKLEEAALGVQTSFAYEGDSSVWPLCADARDSVKCVESYKRAGQPPSILWLGNSQLAAVNRPKSGDRPSPVALHETLRATGHYVVTYAQPNANLMEHGLIFSALAPVYRPRLLILPVFLDDFREQGVRANVAEFMNDPAARAAVTASPISAHLPVNLASPAAVEGGGHEATLQRRVEAYLEGKLSEWWPLWKSRVNIRGLLAYTLHQGRNKLFGINAQTKRSVSPQLYAEKMQVLDAILRHARANDIKVLLYVPPYRRDIPGPYVEAQYEGFKRDLKALAAKHQSYFADLDNVVPGPEWATVVDAVYGFEDYDFMHFTADGHRRHAEALANVIRQIGF